MPLGRQTSRDASVAMLVDGSKTDDRAIIEIQSEKTILCIKSTRAHMIEKPMKLTLL
jgi:hypothetical protein